MKKFTKFDITAIKNTAHSVNPIVRKKTKLMEQVEELQKEIDTLQLMQEQYEAPIRTLTGGYSSEDLVDKVVEDTGKVDKDGKPIKTTKYVLKYPETVIPVTMEEENCNNIDEDAVAEVKEVPAEEAVIIDPSVKSPLAETPFNPEESGECGTNVNEAPFMN